MPELIKRRHDLAQKTVRTYTSGSAAVGLILVPALDAALLLGAQIKMIKDLTELYDTPFSEHRSKSIIASLIGSIAPLSLTGNLLSLSKGFPVLGQLIGFFGMPIFGGASTYAVGQVFVRHFESGGTLLSFDPDKMKAYYKEQFDNGKEVVKQNFAGVRP